METLETTGTASKNPNEDCETFIFVITGVIMGITCLLGFINNGVTFIVCWKQKGTCPLVRIMLILSVTDGILLWMLYLSDVMPGLAHVAPFMQHCTTVCDFVTTLTSPIQQIVHSCSSWLVVFIAYLQFLLVARPLQANKQTSTHNIHKAILSLALAATISSIPLIFKKQVAIATRKLSTTNKTVYSENYWVYQGLYINGFQFLAIYLVPVVISSIFAIKLTILEHKQDSSSNVTSRLPNVTMTRLVISIVTVCTFTSLMPMVHKLVSWASGPDTKCGHVEFYLSAFSKLFIAANAAGKFILYCLFMPRFLKHLRNAFRWNAVYDNLEPFGYKCQDISEMTLISNAESTTQQN